MNSTQVSYFTLTAYFDSGTLKYLYFLIVFFLFIFTLSVNLLLIVVICANRSLHEPMYMFLCSLFVNELYGCSWLLPFLLVQILSDAHNVSVPLCFQQIFCVNSYTGVECLTLAVMSYDRYLAICCPLQYNTRMMSGKIAALIAATWFLPFLTMIIWFILRSFLLLCGNVVNKVYCGGYSVVKLSCSDAHVINLYGLGVSLCSFSGIFFVIFYTYAKILKVCASGSKQARQKAVSTCSLHLASLLNFCIGAIFDLLQSRFNMSSFPNKLRIFFSLYFLTCAPLVNPVMYGLNLSKIRLICKGLILKARS